MEKQYARWRLYDPVNERFFNGSHSYSHDGPMLVSQFQGWIRKPVARKAWAEYELKKAQAVITKGKEIADELYPDLKLIKVVVTENSSETQEEPPKIEDIANFVVTQKLRKTDRIVERLLDWSSVELIPAYVLHVRHGSDVEIPFKSIGNKLIHKENVFSKRSNKTEAFIGVFNAKDVLFLKMAIPDECILAIWDIKKAEKIS